jgi:hypothetical protein
MGSICEKNQWPQISCCCTFKVGIMIYIFIGLFLLITANGTVLDVFFYEVKSKRRAAGTTICQMQSLSEILLRIFPVHKRRPDWSK